MAAYKRGLVKGLLLGIYFTLIGFGGFFVSKCKSQDLVESAQQPMSFSILSDPSPSGRLRLKIDETVGLWWPMETAQQMQAELSANRERAELVDTLEIQVETLFWSMGQMERAVRMDDQTKKEMQEAWDQARDRVRELEHELTKPGRSRALWFSVGVGAALLGGVAVALIAR